MPVVWNWKNCVKNSENAGDLEEVETNTLFAGLELELVAGVV